MGTIKRIMLQIVYKYTFRFKLSLRAMKLYNAITLQIKKAQEIIIL